MGFRKDTFATVWEVEPISDLVTKGRISISRKNKQTGVYEQDFGGYVKFIGSAAAKKAAQLKEKDRIKIGDVDVSNTYDREKKVTYTDFKVFSFEMADGAQPAQQPQTSTVDEGVTDEEYPF